MDYVYRILGSTNLVDWTPLSEFMANTKGTLEWIDPDGATQGRRFYRASVP